MNDNTITDQPITQPTDSTGVARDVMPGNGVVPADAAVHGNGGVAGVQAVTELVRPLRDFLPGGPATDLAVTLPSGDQVVVLRRADDGQVEVWSAATGHTTRRDADTQASPVTDPAGRDGLLCAAVHELAEQRHTATVHATRAVADRDREREDHERVLADIRAYAIDKHLDGDQICRSGLNDFLEAFGLGVFEPRVRVHYTLTGVYDVEGDDPDAAERDARGYLKPELSELDNVVEDSDSHTVRVDRVEELDT